MRWIAALLIIVLPSKSVDSPADQEGVPSPYVVAVVNYNRSQSPCFYFKMSPNADSPLSWDDGYGAAYQVDVGEKDVLLWKTAGWYASRVFLAIDGQHLVRLGNWARGRTPNSDNLAIAFYADGKLIKSYSETDLIKDVSKAVATATHHSMWGRDPQRFIKFDGPIARRKDDTQFELTTVDGIHYVFSVSDGSVLSAEPK